jgi:hypothetical protein
MGISREENPFLHKTIFHPESRQKKAFPGPKNKPGNQVVLEKGFSFCYHETPSKERHPMSTTPVKAVLFTLTGGGDRSLFWAPQSAFDWCFAVDKGEHVIPDHVQADMAPFMAKKPFGTLADEILVTAGSPDNDAALNIGLLCQQFDSIKDAMAHATLKGWVVSEDEYDGYSY